MNGQHVNNPKTASATVWHVLAYILLIILALAWALMPVVRAAERATIFDGGAAVAPSADQIKDQSAVDNIVGDQYVARQSELVHLSAAKYQLWLWIGDNDGYGYGVADGATLPYSNDPNYNWLFDNRSTAEKSDLYARYTDYQSFSQSDFTLRFTFDPTMFLAVDTAWIIIDISGLQQNVWANVGIGPTRLYLDGIEETRFAVIPSQGAWGSGLFTYGVSKSSLTDGVLNASFDLQFSSQSPYFDPFSVDFARLVVSGNLVPPSVPVLVSPSNGSSTDRNFPTFTWKTGTGAVAYDLQVDDDPAFGSPLVSLVWYEDTSYTASSSIPNDTYYWRASAWGPSEDWSGWSAANKFTITGSYRVPSEFPTIQAAVSAIPIYRGGEVLVAAGTYTGVGNRNIGGFGDKSVQVRSESGSSSTVIDCQNADRAFYFDTYTGAGTAVEGFTIRNGTDGVATTGGAIQCVGGWPTINNCVIEYCSQGGVYATAGGRPTLNNCSIHNNDYWGVNTYNGGNVVINNCTFYANRSRGLDLNGSTSSTVVTNSSFSNNIGWEGEGAGAYVYNSAPRFENCTFQSNESHGLNCWNSNPVITGCTFANNGSSSYGGGLYAGGGGAAAYLTTVTNCTFENNNGYYGGGLYLYNTEADISNTLFNGNTAQLRGGAIYVNWGSVFSSSGCTFVNNSAPTGSGIYIESDAGAPSVDGNDITGRPAAPGGKSLGGAMVSECLLAYNLQSAPVYLETYAWIEIMCSDIYGNVGGNWTGSIAGYLGQDGNISANPLFCNAAGDVFTVAANSPVADANTSCATIGAFDVGCAAVQIGLSPASLTFTGQVDGASLPPQNLTISNLGGSVLNWTLTKKSNWLQVSSASGAAPSTVAVSVNKTGLSGGVYYDTLVVSCLDATNSPQRAPVMLTLTSAVIAVAPTALSFEAEYGDPVPPASQTISISNSGSGTLSGALTHGQSWLSLSVPQFTAPPAAVVTVSVDPAGLIPGTWQDSIVIAGENALNSPQYVDVTLTITNVDAPALEVTSSSHPYTGADTLMVPVNAGDNLGMHFRGTSPLPNVTVHSPNPPSGSTFLPLEGGEAQFNWTSVPPLSGTTYMTVIADDGWQADSLIIGIAINQAPSISSTCGDASLAEGQSYQCQITAQDPDNPSLTINWNGVPSNNASFADNGDGTADFSFTPDASDVDAAYTAIFSVSDALSSAADTVLLDVTNRQLTVQAMQPSPGADDDILVIDSIQIQFNEGIDLSTLPGNLAFSSAKGTPLGYRYAAAQHFLLIGAASGYLRPLDTIGVTINAGLRDLAGYGLDKTYVETFVTGTAVYPGDANRDGLVDGRDVLPMGLFWGNTGPARSSEPDLTWAMSPGHVAFSGSRWSPWRGAYADADGSGMVDPNDICGVTDNYSLTHMIADDDKDHGTNLVTSLDMVEESVLQALYLAVIDCPESEGRSILRESLEAALGQPVAQAALPTTVELYQNYPNPFNPLTTIRFYLPTSGRASLSIYNLLGQQVATLINGQVNSGYVEASWDGTDDNGDAVASGIYFYRLETDDFSQTRRMLLLK